MTTDPAPLPKTTHPYAVRVSLTLGSNLELNLSEDDVRLPFADNYTLRVVKEHANPREEAIFHKRITVYLEAFPSACQAERAGKLLALSLLWVAASKRVAIRFERWAGDFPFAVRDRNQCAGPEWRAEGRVHSNISPEEFSSIAGEAYRGEKDFTPNVLTSMEFYASARMESTEQARFIGLMTALEALSVQLDYNDEIGTMLDELASRLEDSSLLAGEENASLRSSLSDRLRKLRQESVRQAIIRVVKEHIKEPDTIRFVDEAYRIRSKILHEGLRSPELHALTNRLEDVMRQIYSAILGLPLDRPIRPA